MKMISRVISERENGMVKSVRDDLEAALEMAKKDNADVAVIARLRRMKTLADVIDKALGAFLSTARFDVVSAMGVLLEPDDDVDTRKKH